MVYSEAFSFGGSFHLFRLLHFLSDMAAEHEEKKEIKEREEDETAALRRRMVTDAAVRAAADAADDVNGVKRSHQFHLQTRRGTKLNKIRKFGLRMRRWPTRREESCSRAADLHERNES